jgi:predicted membrane-bound spermidine synthase
MSYKGLAMSAARQGMFTEIQLNNPAIKSTLYVLFFLSGCSALIYQVAWQRMLFTLFGLDLVSITVVISVFMFGLGLGGIIGGILADRMPSRLLSLYIIIEVSIGIFGFASPYLIDALGALIPSSEIMTALISFSVLALPTILMGATFPILVTHINKFDHNIGRSVGSLYFANTLGGAAGAYASGFVLLYSFDLVGVINRAAFLNLMITLIAFLMFRSKR